VPNTTAGTITLTGNLGSSFEVPLTAWGVTFSANGHTLTVTPSAAFKAGEEVTVSWVGLLDALCNIPVPPPEDWTFTAPVAPCTPGLDGMVGSTQTRIPSGLQLPGGFDESFVAVDASPDGYVYVGSFRGTMLGDDNPRYQTYRIPKAGGPLENVYHLAGLGAEHMGYVLIIDGDDIYTVDNAAAPANHVVFRITRDGGKVWDLENVATFEPAAADDFQGGAAYGGRLYLITHENSFNLATQIWSVDPNATPLPTAAVLERTFGANAYYGCGGLSIDAQHYYTQCQIRGATQHAVVRINRETGEVEELTRALSRASVNNPAAVHAVDHSGDGIADVVYVQVGRQDVHYICLGGSAPYVDRLATFRATTAVSNWGMAYDASANALWVFDDSTFTFVKIQ
jgi:hypothetical protein